MVLVVLNRFLFLWLDMGFLAEFHSKQQRMNNEIVYTNIKNPYFSSEHKSNIVSQRFQTLISRVQTENLIGFTPNYQSKHSISHHYSLKFQQAERYPQLVNLLTQLLKPIPQQRLKFAFIVIHPFLKQFPTPPHILPTTVFSCPPSESYKEQYFKKFTMEQKKGGEYRQQKISTLQQTYLRSEKEVANQQNEDYNYEPAPRPQKPFKTQMELKSSERTLSENNAFIQQFADISDSFGFGYQMNSGLVCFVFNDQTEYFYPSGNQREVRARNRSRKGGQVVYSSDKLPEEEQIRKKIYILEAFKKTLKRNKSNNYQQKERFITVSQYCRTKYASVFLLNNDTVQVFFNDKMQFLLSKNSILVQYKNNDHFQEFDYTTEDGDIQVRRDYCLTLARKIFNWQNYPEERILDTNGLIDFQS